MLIYVPVKLCSRITAQRKVGVVLKSIVFFSFYVYTPLFLRIISLHILHLRNETNIPFDLIKKPTSFCAMLLKSKALQNDDQTTAGNAESFLQLCTSEWNDEIAGGARRTLQCRKLNNTRLLPLVEDVCKLHKHLHPFPFSIRVVPLVFQARCRRRRPNLGLVCSVYFVICNV